jgi:hypothetical protein
MRGRRRDEVPDPVLFKLEEEEQDDFWLKPRNRGSERRRQFVPKTNKSWQLPRKTISWRKNMTNMIISDGGEVNTTQTIVVVGRRRTRRGGDDETRFQIQFFLSWKKNNKTIPGQKPRNRLVLLLTWIY